MIVPQEVFVRSRTLSTVLDGTKNLLNTVNQKLCQTLPSTTNRENVYPFDSISLRRTERVVIQGSYHLDLSRPRQTERF